MFELGRQSRREHQELGRTVAKAKIHLLYLLGQRADEVRQGALAAGMGAENIFIGKSHGDLAKRLRAQARTGDWLLLKGSRGMKMEKILGELKGGEA
jgi:UDP-N-acetylmuramyl pentapeptide synthase